MIKISVIVPVYNTENFLGRCIESILNQSYSNFELILINDGSKDNSADIIRGYAQLDERIVFIDNKNNGVSETRNIGIRAAKGEYIQFVDSDDFIELDMLEKTVYLIENENADLVITGLFLDVMEKDKIASSIQSFDYKISNNKKQIVENVLDRLDGTYMNSPVNKLYKKSILKENNIYMDKSIDLGEDLIFNLEYLKYCNKVIFENKAYYHYVMKSDENLTAKYREDKLELMYYLYNKGKEYIECNNMDSKSIIKLNNIFIKWMYSAFIDLNNKNCPLTYNEKILYIKNAINKYKFIINNTEGLSSMYLVLKLALKFPNLVMVLGKVIHIVKVTNRQTFYKKKE